jgi:hypothetical protein
MGRSWFGITVASALLAAFALSCAAAAAERTAAAIPFERVVRGFSGGEGPKKPTAFVVLKASDVATFEGFLRPEDARRVHQVDLAARAVVVAFSGREPSTGFRLTVRRLSMARRTLRIIVELRRPAPTTPVLPAVSHPYDVVKVGREAFGTSGPTAWLLVSMAGRVLARGSS